jgi:hypothetical protein
VSELSLFDDVEPGPCDVEPKACGTCANYIESPREDFCDVSKRTVRREDPACETDYERAME